MTARLITHLDDVGITSGTVHALHELAAAGTVTSASVLVPTPWFDDVAEMARHQPDLDLGIHLTLTCESDYLKWGPVAGPAAGSGLTDGAGHFWKTVQEVRDRAAPKAVERELRAQIDRALEAGIRVSHLDHHMGAALSPEFATATMALGREYDVPVLFPRAIDDYFVTLGKGTPSGVLHHVRDRLDRDGELLIDRFVMGLERPEPDVRAIYEQLIEGAGAGTTFVSLHCSAPGDIELVHPKNHRRRVEEYELFGDPSFSAWLADRGIELTNFRLLSDAS